MAILASKLTARQYRLVASLARGGMGEVFVGQEVGPKAQPDAAPVAIKTLLPEVLQQDNMLERFLDEARISARLDHPNIARLQDFGEAAGRPFTVFELLVGANLGECLDALIVKQTQMPAEVALAVVAEACRGLHHAHTLAKDGSPLQVVHRDLSPSNLFLGANGEVKVLDFGAAWARDRITQTAKGLIIGKLEYMAPEQVQGKPVDARTDVFALGLCLHEFFTLKRPYACTDEREQISRIYHAQVPPLERLRPGLGRPIYQAVRRATAADPKHRFQSAAELAQALDEILGDLTEQPAQKILHRFYLSCFGPDRDVQRARRLTELGSVAAANEEGFAWEAPALREDSAVTAPAGAGAAPANGGPKLPEPDTDPEPGPFATASEPAAAAPRRSYLGFALIGAAVLAALFVGLIIGRVGASLGP